MICKFNSVIFTVCFFLLVTPIIVAEETNLPGDETLEKASLSYLGQDKATDTIFKFEKVDRQNLLQLKGSGINRKDNGDNTGSFGLEALFGHLFSPTGDQFAGYYFLSGRLESDNRQRLNATLGYFLPGIGGETKLTYRLLNAEVKDTLQLDEGFELFFDDEFSENALEQGIGFTYRKRLNIFIKELAFRYAYTHMGGENIEQRLVDIDTPTTWSRTQTDIGFGDVNSHEALLEMAVGIDGLENAVLKGIRLDVGTGYQNVNYGEFLGTDEITNEGFSGIAELKACTPAGLIRGWYQDSQAAKTSYGGYQLGGLELYYKNINYEYGQDEEILGIAFTVDMFDPSSSLDRSCPRFFYPSDTGYANVSQMQHIGELASNEFTAKPKVRVIYEDIYRVDKTGLPGNVRVDDSGGLDGTSEPKLVVMTSCPPVKVTSVNPPSASSAFGVGTNEISIGLAGLPQRQQTVVARIDDKCCGDTLVTVTTNAGLFAVNSVTVQERVDCKPEIITGQPLQPEQPRPPPSQVPQQTQQPQQTQSPLQCVAYGSICDVASDTCCSGSCLFAYNTGNSSIYICQ